MATERSSRPGRSAKPPPPPTKDIALQLDRETLARIDALVPDLSTSEHAASRTDVMLAAICAGLDALEKPAPTRATAKRREDR